MSAAPLLEAAGLVKQFASRDGHGAIRALTDVSLALLPGETLGVVGESGSGKSTLARVLLRLIEPDSGAIRFDGSDLRALDSEALRRRRRDMQIVFQDPYAALDPRLTVGTIIAERARRRRRPALSARILRRPAPAHRDCARDRARTEARHRRRAGLGA
jgi:peptide/nickel transport system ATP-binding protein/oligopeptide transport system ATP-binding protein